MTLPRMVTLSGLSVPPLSISRTVEFSSSRGDDLLHAIDPETALARPPARSASPRFPDRETTRSELQVRWPPWASRTIRPVASTTHRLALSNDMSIPAHSVPWLSPDDAWSRPQPDPFSKLSILRDGPVRA